MALDPNEIHYGIRGQKYGPIGLHTFVDRIRAACGDTVSLVAESKGRIVGHIFFSPVTIVNEDREVRGMGLAPMAVELGLQRRGIGSRPNWRANPHLAYHPSPHAVRERAAWARGVRQRTTSCGSRKRPKKLDPLPERAATCAPSLRSTSRMRPTRSRRAGSMFALTRITYTFPASFACRSTACYVVIPVILPCALPLATSRENSPTTSPRILSPTRASSYAEKGRSA